MERATEKPGSAVQLCCYVVGKNQLRNHLTVFIFIFMSVLYGKRKQKESRKKEFRINKTRKKKKNFKFKAVNQMNRQYKHSKSTSACC